MNLLGKNWDLIMSNLEKFIQSDSEIVSNLENSFLVLMFVSLLPIYIPWSHPNVIVIVGVSGSHNNTLLKWINPKRDLKKSERRKKSKVSKKMLQKWQRMKKQRRKKRIEESKDYVMLQREGKSQESKNNNWPSFFTGLALFQQLFI